MTDMTDPVMALVERVRKRDETHLNFDARRLARIVERYRKGLLELGHLGSASLALEEARAIAEEDA